MNTFKLTCSIPALVAMLSVGAPAVYAEDTTDAEYLARELEKQTKKIEAEEKKLADEHAELDALKAKIEKFTGKKTSSPAQQQVTVAASNSVPSNSEPQEVGIDRKPATPEKPPEVAKYIEEGGVLLPKGKLVLTPGVEYDRISSLNVAVEGFSVIPALNIGSFQVSQVNQDILMSSLDARLGVTNHFEVEAKVPYIYGDQSTTGRVVGGGSTADTVSNISGYGLGDIEVAAHYQLNNGQNNWPYLISNLRFKTITGEGPFEIPVNNFGLETRLPTGSGFYALQPSMTAIYPSDPVVFYGNLGYTYNFQRSFPVYGTINPGDSINASFGMSTSLNDATSLSIGYSHDMVFDTQQNGAYLPGSRYLQVGSVDFGWAYILNDRISLNLNVSAGVTSDAPDDRVIFRVPIAFDVF